jgi:hypothetical protein
MNPATGICVRTFSTSYIKRKNLHSADPNIARYICDIITTSTVNRDGKENIKKEVVNGVVCNERRLNPHFSFIDYNFRYNGCIKRVYINGRLFSKHSYDMNGNRCYSKFF